MPNIKIGKGTVNIPSNINTADKLQKIIREIKLGKFFKPTTKNKTK